MEKHSQALIISAALLLHCLISCRARTASPHSAERKGTWKLLLNNTGVVGVHMVLTHWNTVILFDRSGSGQSGYQLRHRFNGTRCKGTRDDLSDSTCYAHSVEYSISNNSVRHLNLMSDTFSSSGSILSDGRIVQSGGFGDASRRIHYIGPCKSGDSCDWSVDKKHLSENRWYASSQILPANDRIIVVGGRGSFTYEFVPKMSTNEKAFHLPFLQQTNDGNEGGNEGGNNLYPIVHLSSDGNLFIFANRDSILFNYKQNKVVKKFPRIPGLGSRSYPSTGSSVILPLDHKDGFQKVEVMICGGATTGANAAAQQGNFLTGLSSCGRMVITGNKNQWKMENMPGPRLMHDIVLLPTGHVLIINGAKRGCAGWNNAATPALEPYLYNPKKTLGRRFSVLKSTKIARMYDSSAILVPDGSVLVAGSNPNNQYTYKNVSHPTELRLQAFVPDYMGREYSHQRPHNVSIHTNGKEGIAYGNEFLVRFLLGSKPSKYMAFIAYAPPFTTHSLSMNQRMLRLRCTRIISDAKGWWNATVEAPPSANVAPTGFYLLSVVNDGIPSISEWVKFIQAAST
ncbi:aldehyde oxidase GLOX-like [Lycium barbarum]|uniref:aldehyde oxidase GLOX-like n=1 Tax=Lycium barbarum TaxID=112863 RepID=UPI00293E69F5|nr:aldehyde oxidase GLOX-like [Lycium barbarum]